MFLVLMVLFTKEHLSFREQLLRVNCQVVLMTHIHTEVIMVHKVKFPKVLNLQSKRLHLHKLFVSKTSLRQ